MKGAGAVTGSGAVRLDPAIRVGDLRIAALSQVTVRGFNIGAGLVFHASKTPVAVLIGVGDTLRIEHVDGHTMSEAALESLCPGASDRFRMG